ncbi:hypothetical protein KAU40_01130 [Candidatus Parcubacteria bacterium]|nr:hypothetical protein [Candidatus Parcubacteria bacterium]
MKNKSLEKTEIINCPHCKLPLLKQVKNKTVKRVEFLYRNKKIEAPLILDIKNKKLPIPLTCPRCKRIMPLTFIVEELTGITFSYKGESFEMIKGKKKQITKKGNRKIHKIYLKLGS